jgi:exonuclease VII small subunit
MDKQQKIQQARDLLAKARYLDSEEIFTIESALDSNRLEVKDLDEIITSLQEYTTQLNQAYTQFKGEMQSAIKELLEEKLEEAKSE